MIEGTEEQDLHLDPVEEATVQFGVHSDRDVMNIVSQDHEVVLVEISGYDLRIAFNMPYLQTMEDIEAAVKGIAELFRKEITEQLLEHSNLGA